MATQIPRKRKPAVPPSRQFVSASVRLDVNTHARVAAAAALAGIDRSAWINRAINEALAGIVVFDRRSSRVDGDLSSPEGSAA